MKQLLREFRAFASRGNILDLAVGVMIGGAFAKITTSLVNDLFMPVLSLLTGSMSIRGAYIVLRGGRFASLEEARAAGAIVLNYGGFVASVLDFLTIALVIFLFMKLVNQFFRVPDAPAPEPCLCPYCKTEVRADATRCPHCTSEIPPETDSAPG